ITVSLLRGIHRRVLQLASADRAFLPSLAGRVGLPSGPLGGGGKRGCRLRRAPGRCEPAAVFAASGAETGVPWTRAPRAATWRALLSQESLNAAVGKWLELHKLDAQDEDEDESIDYDSDPGDE